MDSRVLLALCCLFAAGALAFGVARRARRSDLHALLLALLASSATWSAGITAWGVLDAPLSRHIALRVGFLGVLSATQLWLVFALRAARPALLERLPLLPPLVLLPSALAYVALLTDSAHHGMLGVDQGDRFQDFSGPLLLAFVAYTMVCLLGATAVLGAWTWRLRQRADLHRVAVVATAVAALLPIAAAGMTLSGIAPPAHAMLPASLIVSLLLLTAGPLRDRLLRAVPLAHRDVFDALRDGVLVANAGGAIVDANPAAERILGRPHAQLRGRELCDVIADLAAPERSSSLRSDLADLAATTAPLRLDVTLGDGRRLEVRAACVGSVEEPLGRYALLRDRTEERRFAEVARRAQKLETVATLAGGVAHEVSNPLAFVRANLAEVERLGAAVLDHLAAGPSPLAHELADLRDLAREALDGIARIERIAAGMRRLSTAGEGFAPVELGPVLDEAVLLARIRFAKPLAVELHLDPQLPAVRGASALLVQALLHLLLAAQRSAQASGGAIRVEGLRIGAEVVLRVGWPQAGPDALPAAQRSCGVPGEAAGDLSLPIARDIARDHGGELEIGGSPSAPTALALHLPLAEVV